MFFVQNRNRGMDSVKGTYTARSTSTLLLNDIKSVANPSGCGILEVEGGTLEAFIVCSK